ncbi:MAG TPA: hypothetical protein P5316_09650 [Phycisphaerae bacterium]|nr:hypothetical protein [Phycisphaerae bacterium]
MRRYLLCLLALAMLSGQACNTRPADNGGPSNGGDNTNGGGSDDGPAIGGVPAERLQAADFNYLGAFRLPDEFNWGALGLCYYPDGGGAGSLLVTGFQSPYDSAHPGEACWSEEWNCRAYFGEVTIPTPAVLSNWEDLPVAALRNDMRSFDGGLVSTLNREWTFVSDIEYVPRQGTQSSDKLYGSLNFWYAEGGVGENTFPTVWFANLDGTQARGLFHVGPDAAPYHGRKMGAYLFTVPGWYADRYLGGRTLVTGRSRGTPRTGFEPVTTDGGSQGPTLFAFRPWDSDNPTGNLDALPVLYYRVAFSDDCLAFPCCGGPNVGNPAQCDYPDFTMCDDWTGAAFVDNGTRRAVMLLGYKGLGNNCYDEPPVDCNDPCSETHGYHCNPYERQVIFYDVHELGTSALGQQNPWVVVPYAIWRPTEFYLAGHTCWNVGGMTFDAAGLRLFMAERGLGEGEMNAVVVHVWSLSAD